MLQEEEQMLSGDLDEVGKRLEGLRKEHEVEVK